MEKALWYLIAGTRGGENRARVIRCLLERPRNPNQLAEELDLNYDTVRHHLDVLADNGVVTASGDEYGAVYLPSDAVRNNWEIVETITDQLDQA